MMYHCRPDGTSVAMGTVDEASVVGKIPAPTEHIFLGEKAGWWNVASGDGLARYAANSPSFQARMDEWIAKGCPRRADVDACNRDLPNW